MNDFGQHLLELKAAGFDHAWATGHTEFWFHRRSMKDHTLFCTNSAHEEWVNLDPECPHVEPAPTRTP